MNPNSELQKYIDSRRQQGIPASTIISELQSGGWNELQLKQQAPGLFADAPVMNDAQSALPQSTRLNPRKLGIVAIVCLLIVATISAVFLLTRNNANDSVSTFSFNDPNFSMEISEGWSGDAGYEPGSSLILYYSPEDASSTDREKGAGMTIYAGLDFDRVQAQLDNLEESGAEYEILQDEEFEINETRYRFVELIASSPESPDNKVRIMSVNAIKGDLTINADISSLSKYWDLHATESEYMLKSIEPACAEKNPNAEEFSQVKIYCL